MTHHPADPESKSISPPDPATHARFERFRIGAIDCIALSDGSMPVPLPPPPGASPGADAAAPKFRYVPLSCLLVSTPESGLVLMDSGFGFDPASIGLPMRSDGRLLESLASAGFGPDDIDIVLISHLDPDHVGGLYDTSDSKVFPQAQYYAPAEAVAFWSEENIDLSSSPCPSPIKQRRLNASARLFKLAAGNLKTFEPGAEIVPGISAMALPGHAPGQVGFVVSSDGDTLLYTADAIVHEVISVETPDVHNPMDLDPHIGRSTREALLKTLAESGWHSFSPHFSWPSFGKIQSEDGRSTWKPGQQ